MGEAVEMGISECGTRNGKALFCIEAQLSHHEGHEVAFDKLSNRRDGKLGPGLLELTYTQCFLFLGGCSK